MDALQQLGESVGKLGDLLTAVTSTVERGITGWFGSSNERRVKNIGFVREKNGDSRIIPGSLIDQIGKLEPSYQALSDEELSQTSVKLRARLDAGETLDDILRMLSQQRASPASGISRCGTMTCSLSGESFCIAE